MRALVSFEGDSLFHERLLLYPVTQAAVHLRRGSLPLPRRHVGFDYPDCRWIVWRLLCFERGGYINTEIDYQQGHLGYSRRGAPD